MDDKKAQEIFSDEEFVVSLLKMETPEEVQAAVKTKGLELSISDIEWIKARLLSGKTGELSADDLENIAGGYSPLLAFGGGMAASFLEGINLLRNAAGGLGNGLINVSNSRW